MQNAVRVELVPVQAPAPREVLAERTEVVQKLAELGHIDPAAGRVNDSAQGWLARINGVECACLGYEIAPAPEGGRAVVSLVFEADAVSIGEMPSAGQPTPQVRPATPNQKPGVWGQPGPDPRDGFPGWEPEGTVEVHVDPAPVAGAAPTLRDALQRSIDRRGVRR